MDNVVKCRKRYFKGDKKMSKILDVNSDVVLIGTDDGKIKEVRRGDVKFEPKIGDKVDIFENDNSVIVTKLEEKVEEKHTEAGVNININNANNNNTNQGYTYQGNGKKVVNKVVYLLLTFFLGWIGVHKFYSGKTGSGVCYLLFCWTGIPGIIAVIEFIAALFAKEDSNGNILV